MALITSDCDQCASLIMKWPSSPRIRAAQAVRERQGQRDPRAQFSRSYFGSFLDGVLPDNTFLTGETHMHGERSPGPPNQHTTLGVLYELVC